MEIYSVWPHLYLAFRKWKGGRIQSFNTRSSTQDSFSTAISSPRSGQTGHSSANSCLSPDLLAGIKYSLSSYSMEDLKRATKNFGEDNKIGDQSFKGMIDDVEVMIKQMRFEDTRQIAFDIATGLHYLHHCIFPTYAHMSVNTRNIFITSTWRAKLASIETNHAVGSSKGNDISASVKGWIAPEYLLNGSVSEKACIGFLGGEGSEGGCFEKLRSFMDSCFKEDYPLAEALCLAVLAEA
ncbi:hypothetical protein Pint_32129 [Pistacia integerrima]|uniref:Uncharacterized protein n=1 Tax=Pistacia integerrima TaxID=434235 RepID=A0ACC0XSW3_9ROSI|nr:hypothetical protein Pint_32129 [Pistacia integerrima]